MSDLKPTIEFDRNGTPATISYNVPEPTSYSGQNVIELDIPTSVFKEDIAFIQPEGEYDNSSNNSSDSVSTPVDNAEVVRLPPAFRDTASIIPPGLPTSILNNTDIMTAIINARNSNS